MRTLPKAGILLAEGAAHAEVAFRPTTARLLCANEVRFFRALHSALRPGYDRSCLVVSLHPGWAATLLAGFARATACQPQDVCPSLCPDSCDQPHCRRCRWTCSGILGFCSRVGLSEHCHRVLDDRPVVACDRNGLVGHRPTIYSSRRRPWIRHYARDRNFRISCCAGFVGHSRPLVARGRDTSLSACFGRPDGSVLTGQLLAKCREIRLSVRRDRQFS